MWLHCRMSRFLNPGCGSEMISWREMLVSCVCVCVCVKCRVVAIDYISQGKGGRLCEFKVEETGLM